jgi:hypothetical protein
MYSLSGHPTDFGLWVQWYAFDVIGKLTFNQTLGFLGNKEDRLGMIDALNGFFRYSSAVGQVPELHRFLLGNVRLQGLINRTPWLEGMDAFMRTEKVRSLSA